MHEERQARIIRRSISACIVLFIAGYAASRTLSYLRGPSLTIMTPQNYALLTEPLLTVRGEARRVAKIRLNGREIFTNEEGIFEDRLLVPPGYSIMTITADDTFNRSITKTIHLVRE